MEGVEKPYVPFDRGLRKEGCQAIAAYDAYDSTAQHVLKSRDPAYLQAPYLRGSIFSTGPNW